MVKHLYIPKHIGLVFAIPHATRSKSLVQLLNAVGHCATYESAQPARALQKIRLKDIMQIMA